jgi:hypothetical protein
LGGDWQLKHVTIGLFEATETIRQALATSLTNLLDKYDLKSLLMSKNEGSNFNTMIIVSL